MVLTKATKNLEKLGNLVAARVNKRIAYRSIEGWYKGRQVNCIIQMLRGWGTPSEPRRFCPIKLCMEKGEGRRRKYKEPFFTVYKQVRSLTANTHLYNDGRIYYTNAKFDKDKMGFYFPVVSEKNKNSLWAFFVLDMTEEDIRPFLEELCQAAAL